jgi:hypothetical protein
VIAAQLCASKWSKNCLGGVFWSETPNYISVWAEVTIEKPASCKVHGLMEVQIFDSKFCFVLISMVFTDTIFDMLH